MRHQRQLMFRIRVRNENAWRKAREIPLLKKLVRADMRTVAAMKNPEVIDMAFSEIDLLSGVSKQTNESRFSDVDPTTLQIIAERGLRRVHDVGVSSGITSLELRRRLRDAGFDGDLFISDKFARFWSQQSGLSTGIFDSDHNLVCAYLGPVVGDSEDSWKLPVSKLVYQRARQRPFDRDRAEGFLLLHPDVLQAIDKGDLQFIDFDVFDATDERTFDFIRCMNLLNRGYFSADNIQKGLRALHSSLATGGVLQVGRTHLEGENHVTFYEKVAEGFQRMQVIGDGSEIDALVRGIQV